MSRLRNRHRSLAREAFWNEHDKDSYECPGCGRKHSECQSGIEVHHKSGHPLDNREENLSGMCRLCHMLAEGKKPALKHIKELRDMFTEKQANTVENQAPTEPIMALHDYTGSWGAVICPGCSNKLGYLMGDCEIQIGSRPCCEVELTNVTNPDLPTLAAVDDEAAAGVDTTGEAMKQWMVNRWCEFLENEARYTVQRCEQVRNSEGEMVVETYEEEVHVPSRYLADIRRVADEWDWDSVSYAAKEAMETESPARAFRLDVEANILEV